MTIWQKVIELTRTVVSCFVRCHLPRKIKSRLPLLVKTRTLTENMQLELRSLSHLQSLLENSHRRYGCSFKSTVTISGTQCLLQVILRVGATEVYFSGMPS